MARDYYDESKKRRKVVKKSQPSSTSINKSIKQAQERGAKRTAQTNVKSQQSFNNKRTTNVSGRSASSSRHVQDQHTPSQAYRDRVNQKSYGTTQPTRRASSPTSSNANRQRNTPATAAEMRRQNLGSTLEKNKDPLGINKSKTPTTAKEMMENRQGTSTSNTIKAKNAAEWEQVKNKSKEEQQKWFTQKAQEAQKRHDPKATETLRKFNEGELTWKDASAHQKKDILNKKLSENAEHSAKAMIAEWKGLTERAGRAVTSKPTYGITDEQRDEAKKKSEARTKKIKNKIDKEQKLSALTEKGLPGWGKGLLGGQRIIVEQLPGAIATAATGGAALVSNPALGHVTAGIADIYLRTYEANRGNVLNKWKQERKNLEESGDFTKEELDDMEKSMERKDFLNALGQAFFEGRSEGISDSAGTLAGTITGGKGLIKTGKGISGIVKSYLGESFEEDVNGIAGAWWSNLIYGNEFQDLNDEQVRRSNIKTAENFWSDIESEEDLSARLAAVNSKDFVLGIKDSYEESGLPSTVAAMLANHTKSLILAKAEGDEDKVEAANNAIVDIINANGGDVREHYTMEEALKIRRDMAFSIGVQAGPSAVMTSQMGNQIKSQQGMEYVSQMADYVKKYNESDSASAASIKDSIDNGEDVSGTNVYDISGKAEETIAQNIERQEAKKDVAAKRMARADLRIDPVLYNEDGTYDIVGPETNRRFEDIKEEAKEIIRPSMQELNMDEETLDLAGEIAASQLVGSITVNEIDQLIENPEMQTAFELATGIDLNSFVVRDRKGNLNQVKTNIAIQEGLLSESADNYVESARLEQEAWNDEARGEVQKAMSESLHQTMSQKEISNGKGRGDVATTKAINTVDPRDRTKFRFMATAAPRVYNDARYKNAEWDDVKGEYKEIYKGLDQSALKGVFEAAKEDKQIAENKNYGKPVKAGDPMSKNSLQDVGPVRVPGKVIDLRTDAESNKLSNNMFFYKAAVTFGSDITLVSDLYLKDTNGRVVYSNTETGEQINEDELAALDNKEQELYVPVQVEGAQDSNGIILNTNEGIERNIEDIAKHETIHEIRMNAPEEFKELARYLQDKLYSADPEAFMQIIQEKQRQYRSRDLTMEEAMEELIAEGGVNIDWDQLIADIETNPEIQSKPTFIEAIKNAFKNVIQKLRSILSSDVEITDEAREATLDQLLKLEDGYKLLVRAARAAKADQANQAINEWQDDVNERYSLGYHAGDLGTARFSISEEQDAEYMKAVESGDMETAQRMVDEMAKQKGYTPRLYHGSSAFGFTEFDLNKMDDKTSIFLTDNEEIASTYSGKSGTKTINERSTLDYANMSEKELADRLNDANIIIADEAVSYDYYDAGRIEALKSEIDSGLNMLSEIVDSKVTEYAERMAEDFNDTDMKTHKQLVQLKKKLDLYKEVQEGKRKVSNPNGLYVEFSTPTYLLLNDTDAFENVDFDVKELEVNVRLFDLLNKEMNRGEASKSTDNWQNYFDTINGEGLIVEESLDGYHLEYVPKNEAINKLRSAVDAGNYALYAKLENPLVIDADGAYWKSIPVPRELLSSFADDYHSHADGNMVMNFENGRTVTNTRSLSSYAKRAGYDGVIFNNLKDHGGLRYDEVSHDLDANIYIAFDPNAVASADPVTYDDNGNVIPLSKRFDMQNPDIRYSLDSEGTELSQGQETFFERSKNRNAEGQLKVMLHGTDADFTEFDPSKARPGTLGRAFYFSDSAAHAGQYGNVGRYYLNLEHPLMGETHDITKDQLRKFVAYLADNEDYGIENYGADATVDSVTDSVWGGTDFTMLRDLNLSAVGDFAEAVKIFNRVNDTDYDGIITDVETAAFYPEQIKRTDNLNPTLSKDTRYSITDSEGRDLSDGQVSYFRNSMARDEQGRLVPVYHSTNKGGFTVFDPSKSDDRRSLFFASNFAVSQTYGRHANRSILGATKYQSFEDIEEDFIKNNWRLMPDYLDSGFDKNNIVKHYKIKVKRKNSILKGSELGANDTARFKEWLRLSETNDEKASQYQVEFKPIGESQTLTVDSLSEMIDYFNKNAPLPSRGYYECYLNLENPLIIDANGANWNSIPYGDSGITIRNLHWNAEPEWDNTEDGDVLLTGYQINFVFESLNDNGEWETNPVYGNVFENPNPENTEWFPKEDVAILFESNGMPASYLDDVLFHADENPMDGSWEYETNEDEEISLSETYKTRDLARMAHQQGYDGVIIRNCRDLGGVSRFKGESSLSDIYIAFSSNQVKDVNNLNPTENPDIRYSIVPEDEVKSKMAYEYAMDDSYEALEYYEQRLADLTEEAAENRPIKNFSEDKIAEFYAGLRSADSWVHTDPIEEEDAVRMAQSKNDFFANLNAKWNDRWTTGGEVLNVKSVKSDVRNLVMGVMQNSDTDSKYRNDLVKKTLFDVRTAFQLMKQDRPDVASELLYYSAQRMIDNVQFYEDSTFDEYKNLKHYLRNTRISLGEEYWSDVEYDEFRKRNFGRIKLVKGRTNVDQVYQELEKNYPEFFNEEEVTSVPDQLLQIEHVLDTVQPYKEAYSSEAAAELAFDIADDLYEIMVNGDEVRSLADTYKARYDAKTRAMKQRHAEAMLRVRRAKEEGIQKERQKFREYKEKQKATRDHRKHYQRIQKNYDWLVQRILDPTKDKNVPEEFRQSLAEMLQTLDMQTENSKKLEAKTGHVAYKTFKMRELKDRLNEMAIKKGDNGVTIFELDANVGYLMDSLVTKLDGQSVDALDATTISEIDTVLAAIRGAMVRHNKIRIENKSQEISEIAGEITEDFLKQVEKRGKAKKYEGIRGGINAINTSELTPVYFFERLGKFNVMYNEVRYGGFDTYVRNEKHIIERMEEITKPYFNKGKIRKRRPKPGSELDKWRDSRSAQTFNLTNGSITLTTAQMMSLYCLSKREQATKHMYSDNGGIVATPIDAGTRQQKIKERLKGKEETNEKLIVNEADIQTIIAALTPEQINVADQLQQLMANDMADLGNEAHREMYGYNVFEEQDYFPIKVHGNEIATDINDIGDVIQKIKSFGPAKPLDPHADNLIEIDDIFSVTVEHCNGMNLYNAFLVPISDFMRVYNYKQRFDDGKDAITVKDALEAAHGKKALDYVVNFMKDINGIKPDNRGGLEGVLNKALGTAKKTAVFGNIRVALQQPTAIIRALAEIDGKHLIPFIKLRAKKGIIKEMLNYCPIAYWKSLGYYDAYMGRDLEDTVMNNWSMGDALLSDAYGLLDIGTWSLIWQAVKSEQAEAHPEMDKKSEEFLQMCGRRASEVFDKTQVVDSTFHRSDAMRSNQIAIKSLTAFMSEPTLTLNVFRAGWQKAIDQWQDGDKAKAAGTFRKTMSVIIMQAALVSLAQAIADAWRGKDPGDLWDGGDDDDDEPDDSFLIRFIHNLTYNFFDNLHLENNIYIVKDAMPLFNFMMSKAGDYYGWNDTFRAIMGWDQKVLYSNGNLIYAGGENIVQGVAQIYKKLEDGDDYDKDWYDIIQRTASGVGTFVGVPAGTLMRDFKPLLDKVFENAFAADGSDVDDTEYSETVVDKVMKHLGYRRKDRGEREESKKQKAYEKERKKIQESVMDLEGEEKAKKTWSKVTTYIKEAEGKSMNDLIAEGDYSTIDKYRTMFEAAGNDSSYFDERVFAASKKALKKSIAYEMTDDEMYAQQEQKAYLRMNGMTDAEISEIAYKSDIARDVKVAMMLGDEELVMEAVMPLVQAGISQEDFNKLWENRNHIDLKKYDGRYKDKLKSTGNYVFPADGIITSDFGNRNSPGGIGSTNHKGLDIAASDGTPIAAADGGIVVYSGWDGGLGKCVRIKHDDGTITEYGHLSWWDVNVGDAVGQGQEIGLMGSTGNSTGPHLHFGVIKNDEYVDPKEYINTYDREWNLDA